MNHEKSRRNPFLVPFLLIAVITHALGIGDALAAPLSISDPDSIAIEDIRAYDSVLEDDDLLVIAEYNLPYASLPDELISDAYLGRFLRSTTELKSVEPFAFNDQGYGRGIFSFYWTASQVTTDSIEFDNPNSEDYKITFQGKIGVFTGSVPTVTSTAITWADATDTKDLLRAHIADLAFKFENDSGWNDDASYDNLIETPGGIQQLTGTDDEPLGSGEEYFANAVPQLQAMIPSIFPSAVQAPDVSPSPSDTSFESGLNAFWDGNWVDTHFETLSTTYQAPKRVFTALAATLFMGLVAYFCANRLLEGNSQAGGFALLTMAVTFPMFGAINWFPLQFVVVVAFVLGVVGVGWVFFLSRAGN